MIEIERKFLISSEIFKSEAHSKKRIVQGFLNTHPERTVRIRSVNGQGFITVKGKSNAEGTTRFEWEKKISEEEAEALLRLCEKGVIEKTRYWVTVGEHLYEVDEFHGGNQGLVMAEIELRSPEEAFKKPAWLGEEVTGNIKYYNSQLSKHPFTSWDKK